MGVAASRTRTSDQDPDVGTGKQTSARPLTHESTALASVVPASPLDTPAIFIGPDQSSHFAIEASLVSPSLGATVLSSVPRVVPVDRPLEIELDHGPCSDVLAFESFARCLSSHALLSVCIATQGRALTYVSAPADVRLSSDGAWNLRALVHPASWTDADSVTVLSLTCAGRPLPCKGLPATIRVGYDNTPAPAGAVLAAAKAGDVLALQAALIAGGSTEEADEVSVELIALAIPLCYCLHYVPARGPLAVRSYCCCTCSASGQDPGGPRASATSRPYARCWWQAPVTPSHPMCDVRWEGCEGHKR